MKEFSEGDVLTIHGDEYEVESVDYIIGKDLPRQYRLKAVNDAPPAFLEVEREGQCFVIHQFKEVQPQEIQT